VAKRGNDARRKSSIQLVYALDVTVADEPDVLTRHPADPQVRPAPDTAYRFPVMAPPGWAGPRPIVIGAGPCGLLAALILAQMGLRPIIIERGKAVRARTKDTWALWRRSVLTPESNVQFGEGGAGTFSTASSQPHQGPAPSGAQGAGGIREGRCACRYSDRVAPACRHISPASQW